MQRELVSRLVEVDDLVLAPEEGTSSTISKHNTKMKDLFYCV
jgi:hypothetical protein